MYIQHNGDDIKSIYYNLLPFNNKDLKKVAQKYYIFFVKINDELNKSIDFNNYSRRDISIDLHLTDNQLTTNIASDDLS